MGFVLDHANARSGSPYWSRRWTAEPTIKAHAFGITHDRGANVDGCGSFLSAIRKSPDPIYTALSTVSFVSFSAAIALYTNRIASDLLPEDDFWREQGGCARFDFDAPHFFDLDLDLDSPTRSIGPYLRNEMQRRELPQRRIEAAFFQEARLMLAEVTFARLLLRARERAARGGS